MLTFEVFTPWQCRQVRRLLGWTLGKLAEETGLSAEFIGFYEAGHRQPRTLGQFEELVAIRAAFVRAGINARPSDLAESGADHG